MILLLGRTLLCLLLFGAGTAAGGVTVQCSVSPAGVLHPVRAQLERFEAGPGCAAREAGEKETHVIALGKDARNPNTQVTVVLRPLSYMHPIIRPVILVLSSQHAAHWVLENEGLPKNLHVMVQMSANSTLEYGTMAARFHSIPGLPWHPRALLRWTLQRHTTVTSLTHLDQANRVYIRLGEDPSLPKVCRLQSLFLSHNYLASELQQQEVNGCSFSVKRSDPEVHIIKLWSAGSGLCGSLQVEVSVSLLPPMSDVGWHNVVLVLSSAAPVNWALVTPGVRGHITVHSSHSVTPLYPPKPDLTMTSTTIPDLALTDDLLTWASQNGYTLVTSYSEANLANRFVIKLRDGRAVQSAIEAKVEETRLRHWLSREVDHGSAGSREAVSTQCANGRLTVSVDKSILQALSLSVSAVTLRDPSCQARSNGSHFLLAFPVISCGTEGEMERHSRGVQYKNTILLWKKKPPRNLQNVTTGNSHESTPLVIHFSCTTPLPTPASKVEPASSSTPDRAQPATPGSRPQWVMTPQAAPLLSMKLFATDEFERRAVGPCMVTAQGRVYAEISGSRGVSGRVEVRSCVLSPLSDPRAHTGWSVIHDFCPADPSFVLHEETQPEQRQSKDEYGDSESDEEEETDEEAEEDNEEDKVKHRSEKGRRKKDRVGEGEDEGQRGGQMDRATEGAGRLRFSFVLRPLFNNSIQFLHCSLQLCGDTNQSNRACTHPPHIPAVLHTHTSSIQQCENRNLSRPVLVTYSPEALGGMLPPPTGKLAQKPRVSESEMSRQSSSISVASPVLISVFAAFLMGIGLVGAMWCIYSCTGRPVGLRRNSPPNSWNAVPSGEQTSSSV